MRVLLVESNPRYAAAIFADLKPAMMPNVMRKYEFDLVLLNLMLRDMDGNSLISRIRLAKHETPIIALSAVPQARLKALSVGADDMVERDVDRAELGARIRAVVRRSRGFSQSQLQVGNLTSM